FGPPEYHSAADYQRVVGVSLYTSSIGTEDNYRILGGHHFAQRVMAGDPEADRMYRAPRRAMLDAYGATLDRLKLDGLVYPAIQMPPPDETMAQDGKLSEGPHSATSWVNMIGVPAIVVPAGFYENGLPFGLEFAGRPWTDGDLLAIAAAWEKAGDWRKPPTLVEAGLLATKKARAGRRTVEEARTEHLTPSRCRVSSNSSSPTWSPCLGGEPVPRRGGPVDPDARLPVRLRPPPPGPR